MRLAALLAGWLLFSNGAIQEVPRELKLRLVEEINRDRQEAGLAPVEFSEELSRAADAHCKEMLAEDYASHWNQAGWKPYLRYAQAGVLLATSENIHAAWDTRLAQKPVWESMLAGHRAFMAEKPPNDGHRRSVLGEWHTHVGIGAAYHAAGLRLIEVFGARHAELAPLPQRAALRDDLQVEGRILCGGCSLLGIAVYYEPLPREMSRKELSVTYAYALPKEEQVERPQLAAGVYVDGTRGSVQVAGKSFSMPLRFWKNRPGVYTIAVWLRQPGKPAFMGAMTSLIVEK